MYRNDCSYFPIGLKNAPISLLAPKNYLAVEKKQSRPKLRRGSVWEIKNMVFNVQNVVLNVQELIQILRAGSVRVPRSAGKCPSLQVPLPSGWAEMKGITPCLDLRSDAQELPADKGFPSSPSLKPASKAGNSRTQISPWVYSMTGLYWQQVGWLLMEASPAPSISHRPEKVGKN